MAPHFSILAWRIPWTEELSGLQSMGSQRVRHNRVTKTFQLWRVVNYGEVCGRRITVEAIFEEIWSIIPQSNLWPNNSHFSHIQNAPSLTLRPSERLIPWWHWAQAWDPGSHYLNQILGKISQEVKILPKLNVHLLCDQIIPLLDINPREIRAHDQREEALWSSSSTVPRVKCLLIFSSVQSLSRVWLFETSWTAACQASLSITNTQSPPKPMSIDLVIPSNHLILCYPLLLLPSIFPSIRVFSNESALHIRWPKYWSFSLNISPSNEHPGLISFRMHWLDLLAV